MEFCRELVAQSSAMHPKLSSPLAAPTPVSVPASHVARLSNCNTRLESTRTANTSYSDGVSFT